MSRTTRVFGVIRGSDGKAAKGAIIEAQLMSQTVAGSPSWIGGNDSHRTESNAYGRFHLDLIPSTRDISKPNNYYSFKIINETTNYYNKIVMPDEAPQDFFTLTDFIAPDMRPPFFGGGGDAVLPPDSDFSGLFSYAPLQGDGVTVKFSVPGAIHMVVLNGVVQDPTADYTKNSSNTITFVSPPQNTDVILIQYRL